MAEYKFAVVDWVDSASLTTVWWEESEIPPEVISTIRSVGFVVRRNRMELVLAGAVSDGSGCLARPFAIPMGCIKRIKFVKLPK